MCFIFLRYIIKKKKILIILLYVQNVFFICSALTEFIIIKTKKKIKFSSFSYLIILI